MSSNILLVVLSVAVMLVLSPCWPS